MSYAIFRGEGIKTLQELSQKGSHNERTKEKYKSNPNIRVEDSKNNIEIIKCNKYVDKFYEITKEYQKEHYDRMKNMRADRKKSFYDMVNDSKSVVADEMIFTSDKDFFKNMSKEELMNWANETMNFVYEELGYMKDQVLHAVIHMDEKVPHLHCVVVPLVKKFDKRTGTIKYTISKRSYVKDKVHLCELQDKYHERLTKKGFKLERGEKHTGVKHLSMGQFKNVARYYDRQAYKSKKKIEEQYWKIKGSLQKSKRKALTDKVIIDGEIYHILLDFLDMYSEEIQNMVTSRAFVESLNEFTCDYRKLEKQYRNSLIDINYLEDENGKLHEDKTNLLNFINHLLLILKEFFREILLSNNKKKKEKTIDILKECYDNNLYNSFDLKEISKSTDTEIEVNDFINKESLEKDYDIFK